uniref:Protein kinase domain-containing protein n=1 Tax=Panagrolaimus davidi TaxID=227884 RepID=A0A914Q198_9BILA
MGNAFSEPPPNLEELPVMTIQGERCHIAEKISHGDYDATLLAWIPEKGYYVVKKIDKDIFEDPSDSLCIFKKYATKANLHDYLKKEGPMKEDSAKETFREIVRGLQYIHSKGISHGNLKPQNILYSSTLVFLSKAVIDDYGIAEFVKEDLFPRSPFCAPEVYAVQPYNRFKADVYSLGILLKEMVTGYKSATVSLDCKNLIDNLTNRNPNSRPSLVAVLNDRWFNNTAKVYSMFYRDD